MVRLTRIYTRTGDDGSTGLGDGTRVAKHDLRVAAFGTVDELSSVLGLVRAERDDALGVRLRSIQNDLFDLGGDLCVPVAKDEDGASNLRVTPEYVARLEGWIDEGIANLEPLDSFILPGGRPAAAWLHFARTVCRRAERLVCELISTAAERERTNPEALRYLNRLSDLLFVLARVANNDGRDDVKWVPGGEREAK